MTEFEKPTTINISKKMRKKLRNAREMGESYEQLFERLLQLLEKQKS